MKSLKRALLAAAGSGLLAGLCGTAQAAPSILGPSGYLWTPNEMTVQGRCVAAGYHHAEGELYPILRQGAQGRVRLVGQRPDVNAYKVNVGIGNRAELGVTAINTGETRVVLGGPFTGRTVGGTSAMFNGKVSLLPRPWPLDAVVGVIDAFGSVERTPYVYGSSNIAPYLQATPVLWWVPDSIRIGAGWATGIIDGAFVNGGMPLTPNFELMFEWMNNHLPGTYGLNGGSQVNLGIRMRTAKAPGLVIDAGTTNFFDTPVFGASYTLCFPKNTGGGFGGEDEGGKGEKSDGKDVQPAPPAAPLRRLRK
jgi:hypothetical protein